MHNIKLYTLLIIYCFFFLSKLQAEDKKLPVIFLNQYLEYDFSSPENAYLGGAIENFKQFYQSSFVDFIKSNSVFFQQKLFLDNSWTVLIYDNDNNLFADLDNLSLYSEWSTKVAVADLQKINKICFVAKSIYSRLQLCKLNNEDLKSDDQSSILNAEILISDKKSESYGRVVLNSLTEPIKFFVKINNSSNLELITKKRNIIPSQFIKADSSSLLTIKLLDPSQSYKEWEVQVSVQDEFFSIPFDSLITLKQDFFNQYRPDSSLNLTHFILTEKKLKRHNFYSFKPFLGFSRLVGNTLNQNATLLSENDIGIKFEYQKNLDSSNSLSEYFNSWSINSNIRKVSYIGAVNNYKIQNSQQFLYSVNGSFLHDYNERLSFGPLLQIEKNTIFKATSGLPNEVALANVFNSSFGLNLKWLVLEQGSFSSLIDTAYLLMLPTRMSGQSTKIGQNYFVKFDAFYNRINNFYGFGFHYVNRNQESSIQKINDQTFDYVFSYTRLF